MTMHNRLMQVENAGRAVVEAFDSEERALSIATLGRVLEGMDYAAARTAAEAEYALLVASRADVSDDDAPGLTGASKAELLVIAFAEGVEGLTSRSTNQAIIDAINAHRAAEGTGDGGSA